MAWRAADSLRRTTLPAAEEAAGFAREGYAAGKFSLLEVLDAQRALSDVREQLNAALLEVQQVRADIARLRARVADPALAGPRGSERHCRSQSSQVAHKCVAERWRDVFAIKHSARATIDSGVALDSTRPGVTR